jgi:hypothetical protein
MRKRFGEVVGDDEEQRDFQFDRSFYLGEP